MAVIEVRDLCKEFVTYRRRAGLARSVASLFTREKVVAKAVARATFSLDRGECVGYVGPNGAGKSTTIKMLTGILYPTSGTVEVCGLVPWKDRRRNLMHIGTVFGQRTQLWWDLPLGDSLQLLRHLYRVPAPVYRRNLELFSDLLGIRAFIDTPVRQLSLGQRMRGDIAAALLHDPDVLYLDEPTIGLDVVVKESIRRFLAELGREGRTTVLLATHDLADIGVLCRRILIIDAGRIVYDGPIEEIRRRFGSESTLVVVLKEAVDSVSADGADEVTLEGVRARIRFDRRRIAASDLIASVSARYPVSDLTIEDASLEKIIRELYVDRKLDAGVS